jgi:hypothetical protein
VSSDFFEFFDNIAKKYDKNKKALKKLRGEKPDTEDLTTGCDIVPSKNNNNNKKSVENITSANISFCSKSEVQWRRKYSKFNIVLSVRQTRLITS